MARQEAKKPEFQSTLPAWGETRGHPPSAGGGKISIHSPRMGRDRLSEINRLLDSKFQSTLPAWGETTAMETAIAAQDISIHSPRMGRDP